MNTDLIKSNYIFKMHHNQVDLFQEYKDSLTSIKSTNVDHEQ